MTPWRGCIRDLTIPAIRAAAIADGTIWSGPHGAVVAAVDDIVAGRVPFPDTTALFPEERQHLAIVRSWMDSHAPEGK